MRYIVAVCIMGAVLITVIVLYLKLGNRNGLPDIDDVDPS